MLESSLCDAHTFNLSCQGNVYSTASISQGSGHSLAGNKLIVATSNRKVFSLELSMSHLERECGCLVVPLSQELQFTYIPSGAEIISIDSFNRSQDSEDYMIGVTIIKSAESGSPGQYLNIYSELEDRDAQSCLSLELDFIPYQLGHCTLQVEGLEPEVAWLLGGSDRRVHVFREDLVRHMYAEVEPGPGQADIMPEFRETLPSVPLWTDIKVVGDRRVSATGCECGSLKVAVVCLKSNTVLNSWSKEFDGPLTSTKLFKTEGGLLGGGKVPTCLQQTVGRHCEEEDDKESSPLNLCVTYSYGNSHVFDNLLRRGLEGGVELEHSAEFDCPTCVTVADMGLNGEHCLLIGTYGQQLLCYSYSHQGHGWTLHWRKSFNAPVLHVLTLDMTGDGLQEVAVVTTTGVQVLQRDLSLVQALLVERLTILNESDEDQECILSA